MNPTFEKLPSGKVIVRRFAADGGLIEEQHTYRLLEIGISYEFDANGRKCETYFSKRRLVSRSTYEKARLAYPDMPAADARVQDFGGSLLCDLRRQQRQKKAEAEKRLAESPESKFPRPPSTNWLRVISGDKSHFVVFASRDWKALARERLIPSGGEWLDAFGFNGGGAGGPGGSVADGLVVGFEVTGNTAAMLDVSRRLLSEVERFVANPPEISQWSGSVRPCRKPKRQPQMAWPAVLPPLIDFLASLHEPAVTIYNHHR